MADSRLLGDVQALVEKERRLMELQLLEKEQELQALRHALDERHADEGKAPEASPATRSGWSAPLGRAPEDEVEEALEEDAMWGGEEPTQVRTAATDIGDPHTFAALVHVNLSDQGVNEGELTKLGTALVHAPSVKSLDVSRNRLGLGAATILGAILAHASIRLEVLDVSDNALSLDAAIVLCRGVIGSQTLTTLDMARNPFSREPGAGKALGEAFARAPESLREVRVTISEPPRDRSAGTKRGNPATFASVVLGSRGPVRSLAMVHAELPRAAVSVIASEGLTKARLRDLDLSMAFIGSGGAALLARAIMTANQSEGGGGKTRLRGSLRRPAQNSFYLLERLTLRMNGIGQHGCLWLARAIASSRALRHVDLSSNDLDDTCAGILAKAVQRTQAPLEVLDLSRNRFYGESNSSQSGAKALLSALRAGGETVVSLGPEGRLEFSVAMKRQLLLVLRDNQAAQAAQRMDSKSARGRDPPATLTLYEQPEPLRTDACQSLPRSVMLEARQLVELRLPHKLGDVRDVTLRIEWESSVPHDWRLVRTRQEADYGDPETTVVQAGLAAAAGAFEPGRRTKKDRAGGAALAWGKYSVESPGWRVGDGVSLEAGFFPETTMPDCVSGAKALVRAVAVRAEIVAAAPAAAAQREASSSALGQAGGGGQDDSGQVLHERAWRTDVLLKVDCDARANLFAKLHEIYVHGGARGGKLVLRWDARVEDLCGRVLMDRTKHHHVVAGVEWKIVKNGSARAILRGDATTGRVTADQDDFAFARYSVDLGPLDLLVGDRVALWLRPAHSALPAAPAAPAVRAGRVLALRSSRTTLTLEAAPQGTAVPRLELAGSQPFRLAQSPYAWA